MRQNADQKNPEYDFQTKFSLFQNVFNEEKNKFLLPSDQKSSDYELFNIEGIEPSFTCGIACKLLEMRNSTATQIFFPML